MYNYSSEETRRKAEELKALLNNQQKGKKNYDGDNKYRWFNFPSGMERVTLRVLPIFEEGGFMVVSKHRELPGERATELCMSTHGMNCPICDVIQQYKGRLDTRAWEKGDKVYVNALFIRATDADGKNPVQLVDYKKQPLDYKLGTPYLTPLGTTTFNWLVDSLTDPEKGDVMHPISGRNITLQRGSVNGAFKNKEFSFTPSRIAETDEEIMAIMQNRFKMQDIWRQPDETFLKKLKESAGMLDAMIKDKLGKLGAGVGAAATTHPRASQPTPAQTLGNPAFSPPPAAGNSLPTGHQTHAMSNGPTHNTFSPPPAVAPTPVAQHVTPVAPAIPAVQPQASYVAPPVFAPPAQAPASAVAPPAGKVAAPPGAPACFSDATVYNEAATKCQVCNYDYHCARAIQSAKQA